MLPLRSVATQCEGQAAWVMSAVEWAAVLEWAFAGSPATELPMHRALSHRQGAPRSLVTGPITEASGS